MIPLKIIAGRILNCVTYPFKWTGILLYKVGVKIQKCLIRIWGYLLGIAACIGIIFGVGSCTMHCCKWQIDPAHTYEGYFLVLNTTSDNLVLAQDIYKDDYMVLNTDQLFLVNSKYSELSIMRAMITQNRYYWFRYVKKTDTSIPTIIQVELLNHKPHVPPKLINRGPAYYIFEKENPNEQKNSN